MNIKSMAPMARRQYLLDRALYWHSVAEDLASAPDPSPERVRVAVELSALCLKFVGAFRDLQRAEDPFA